MHTLSCRGTFLVLENADSSPSSCVIPIADYSFFLTFKLPSPIRHLGDIGIVIDVGLVTIPFLVLILTVCGVRMLSIGKLEKCEEEHQRKNLVTKIHSRYISLSLTTVASGLIGIILDRDHEKTNLNFSKT